MGLLSALSNAVTGLNVNQQNLNVLSQNISNANTPNYSKETLPQSAAFIDGQGTGVASQIITRDVNNYLNAEAQGQTSTNGAMSTMNSYYSQMENLLGQPGATSSVDQTVTSFFTAVQNLANSPSLSADTTVANTGSAIASQISGLATSIQNLRMQADSEISTSVASANTDLNTLQTVNNAIERAAAANQSTAGLLDQRDAALSDLAQYVDIRPSYGEDGEVTVNTTSGITLVSPTTASKLGYSPIASVQTLNNNGQIAPITVTTLDPNGNPIGKPTVLATGGQSGNVTSALTSGKIQALLSVRDSVLPNILTQLDQLAYNVGTQVNALTNQGVSAPPAQSYTGQREVAGNDVSQYSGSIRLAVLTATGTPVKSPYSDEPNGLQPMTLDLGTLNTGKGAGVLSTDDIIHAVNQFYGPPQNKLELGNLNNVQLSVASKNIPDTGSTLGLNFNLNNTSASTASFFVSNVRVLDSSGATVDANPTLPVQTTALSSYTTTAGSGDVVVTTSGANTLTNGETIYLGAPSGPVNGLSAASLTGYFTVQNVSGNSFHITAAGGATASASNPSVSAAGVTAETAFATVGSGATVNSGTFGNTITANLASNISSPYYTVQADVANVDASGNVKTSTVTYRVANNQANSNGNLVGAYTQTGNGSIVAPTGVQAVATASLVDANGNPLPTTGGLYGNQTGYLKITANGVSNTIALDQLDSKQLGLPSQTPPLAGTNQGFSQYYGLNNFFNANKLTATGDTVAGSALNMSVAARIISNPGLISTSGLAIGNPPASPTAAPNFTYQVNSGDNSISQKIASLATASISFIAAGGMPASSTTLSQYAGQMISITSANASDASTSSTNSQTVLNGFTSRAQAVSGVNLDQELANTVVYQNAYTASTRVITVVDQLFSQLLNMIQ